MPVMQAQARKNTLPGKPLIDALRGQKTRGVPFWLMRQAGRYLPEYREARASAGGFLNLVFDPQKAAEVTLQPLRRFGMDAAILFSDILTVPLALGQEVRFAEGEGPALGPLGELTMKNFDQVMEPVYTTVREIRSCLAREGFHEAALIGFAGAPWTVACYMIEGGSSRDFLRIKSRLYHDPEGFAELMEILTQATIRYLDAQIAAGAEAIQLFDSWAGALDETQFRRWSIEPARKIAQALRKKYPDIPLIGFPRGAGALVLNYAREAETDAISLDPQASLDWAAKNIQTLKTVQGNLDPVCLLAGGEALRAQTEKILEAFSGGPFVFNLGHGIHKETPPEHVAQLADIIRSWKNQ